MKSMFILGNTPYNPTQYEWYDIILTRVCNILGIYVDNLWVCGTLLIHCRCVIADDGYDWL